MNLTIIMISIIVIIFGTGFLYQKILSSKNNKKNNEKEQSITTLAQSNFSEKVTALTSIEKETAIKVLEKLGYQKNDIIKLLGADIYD